MSKLASQIARIRTNPTLGHLGQIFAADGIGKMIGFVTIGITARLLGPAGLGRLGVLQALISYLALLSALGLSQWSMRRVIIEKRLQKTFVRQVLTIQVMTALLLSPLMVLALYLVYGQLLLGEAAIGLVVVVVGHLRLDWAAQVRQRFRAIAQSRIGASAALLLATLLFLFRWPTVTTALAVQAISIVVCAGILWRSLASSLDAEGHPRQRLHFRSDRSAFLLALTATSQAIYFNIDRVMLGASISPAELGQYEGAYRVLSLNTSFAVLAAAVTAPLIMSAAVNRSSQLQRMSKAFALAGLAGSLIGVASAGVAVKLLLGEAFDAAVPLVGLLCISISVGWLQLLFAPALQVMRKERILFLATLGAAALNVLLNLILIPRLGAAGAAAATISSEVVVSLALLWFTRPLLTSRTILALITAVTFPTVAGVLVYSDLPVPALLLLIVGMIAGAFSLRSNSLAIEETG